MSEPEGTEALVRYLYDRARIEDLIRTYAYSIDLNDVERLSEVFTDDVRADYGPIAAPSGREEVVHWITSRTSTLSYQHHLVVPYRIDINGDAASAMVYLVSHQSTPDETVRMMNSRYELKLARSATTPLGWQIAALRLEVGIDEMRDSRHKFS